MKRILVVDDDDGTLEAIAELLHDAGYAPLTASSGEDAWILLRESRPDLLLLDLLLPRMTGWQLLALIDEDAELARTPTVVMTGWPKGADLPPGISVIKKPFDWETLQRVVRHHCGAPVAKCLPAFECETALRG